jgi:hypothetical protein
MITSSSLSNAVFDSKYREVCGVRSGRNLAFLLFCDDFPLVLRFEGGGMEVRFGSGMKSGIGDEGVDAGEGWLELSGWDDPKVACAAFRTAIALSMVACWCVEIKFW